MSHPITPTDRAHLHDQAHRRAVELRRQAMADLMDELGRALQWAVTAVGRAARRCAGRLSPQHRSQAAASHVSVEC